ncbi:MAG: AAA family ATPase [Pseudomonadales bacterium]
MYEQHFHFKQLPFSIAPDPSFLYLSSAHREALAHLMYGFSHGGFVMVTGEVGTGKTTLLRNLIKQTPPDLDVAFILNPRLTVRELLATLCDELGIAYNPDTTNSVKQYIDLITRHLLEAHRNGRSTVMIIDEAQNLSPAVLEQVRLLTNLETDDRKLMRIILLGQPELSEMLGRQELRQLAQRITARYHLGSLNRQDTYAYVMHRLSRAGGNPHLFSAGALRRLYSLSGGTPRLINVIADRALLGAYTEGRQRVTSGIVGRAAREVLGTGPDRRRWWVGAAAAVLVAGAAWALLGPAGLPLRSPSPPELTSSEETTPVPQTKAPEADPAPAESAAAPAAGTVTTSPPADARTTSPAPTAAKPPPAMETTDAGESVITPETYARLQAGGTAGTAARAGADSPADPAPATRRQPTPAPVPSLSAAEQPAAGVARPPGSTFSSRRLAYAAVFARWGVDYPTGETEIIPCDFAPSVGLQCLSERGDWASLERTNLPVVLELWDDGASPFYAALLGMQDGNVRLQVGEQRVDTTQRVLRDLWSGNYVILWQTPPGYYGNLQVGQVHETVGWLRRQLASLSDRPLASATPNVFDDGLEGAVLEFQSEEGLTPDGIVGPATWIRLASRLQLQQPGLAG